MNSLLTSVFLKPPSLSQIENIVLERVIAELPEPLNCILRKQKDAISKIQRLDRGREVDFYYPEIQHRPREFLINKDICEIAKVSLKSLDTGHETHAIVQLVKGVLFSINFNAPPNDLRSERLTISISIGAEFREGP